MLVDGTGNKFLASAGFAANEDGDRFGSDAADFLVDPLHRAAVPHDGVMLRIAEPALDRIGHEPAAGDGPGHQGEQLVISKGLSRYS